jgi:hypothetical protein
VRIQIFLIIIIDRIQIFLINNNNNNLYNNDINSLFNNDNIFKNDDNNNFNNSIKNLFQNNNNSNNNIFNNNNYEKRNFEDNSKYIDLGNQWNMSKESDVFEDPFNPKWVFREDEEKKNYTQKDIDLINERTKIYLRNNQGRKNFLEFCDNNSETLQEIRNLNILNNFTNEFN